MQEVSDREVQRLDDRALLVKVAARDESAFAEVYDRFEPILYGFLIRILKSIDDAEDIVQDALMQVWNTTVAFQKDDGVLLRRLVEIVRVRALDRLRARGPRKQSHPIDIDNLLLSITKTPLFTPLNGGLDDQRKTTLAVFQKLNIDEQRTLGLCYFEGCTSSEVAERLTTKRDIVDLRLWRAMGKLCKLPDQNSTTDHDEKYLYLCPAYAFGTLDSNELSEFELHLKSGCAVCPSIITSIKESAACLPIILPHQPSSPELREQVLFAARLAEVARAHLQSSDEPRSEPTSQIEEPVVTQREPRKPVATAAPRRPWFVIGFTLSILVMVVGFSLYVVSLVRTLDEQKGILDDKRSEVASLVSELENRQAVLRVMSSKHVNTIDLNPKETNSGVYGKIYWDPDCRAIVLHASSLPFSSAGKEYRLWMVKDQTPISICMFSIKIDRERSDFYGAPSIEVASLRNVTGFFVTLEPKSDDIDRPTGRTILSGDVAPR